MVRFYIREQPTRRSETAEVNCVTTLTKVVALAMQMLDRKPSEEPILTVEEQPIESQA